MPATVKIKIDADISQFNEKLQELLRNAQNEVNSLNQRINTSATMGPVAPGINMGGGRADQTGRIMGGAIGGGPTGASSAYQSISTATMSIASLEAVSKSLGQNLKSLNEQFLAASSVLAEVNEEQKKSIYIIQNRIKAEESRDAAIKQRIDTFLKGGGGAGGMSPKEMMGAVGIMGGAAAMLLQMPGVALSSAGAMGAITGRNVGALASTDYMSMIRSRGEFSGPAGDYAKMSTLGTILLKVLGGATAGGAAGLLTGGAFSIPLAVAGGIGGLIQGVAGAGSTYANSYEANLESLAKAKGADPIQYAAARGWAMGPGYAAGKALWTTGSTERGLMSLFDLKGIWQGRDMGEAAEGIIGATRFGGRRIGENAGKLKMINELGYAMGLGPGGATGALSSLSGITGKGAGSDESYMYNMFKKAIAEGLDNSQTGNKIIQIMASQGGGLGSAWLEGVAKASFGAYGEQGDLNLKAAGSLGGLLKGMGTAGSGYFGRANWMASVATMGTQRGLLLPGMGSQDMNELEMLISTAGPGGLTAYRNNGTFDKYFGQDSNKKGTAANRNREAFLKSFSQNALTMYLSQSPMANVANLAKKDRWGSEDIGTLETFLTQQYGMSAEDAALTVIPLGIETGKMSATHKLGKGGYSIEKMLKDASSGMAAITDENVAAMANATKGMETFLKMLGNRSVDIDKLAVLTKNLNDLIMTGRSAEDIAKANRDLGDIIHKTSTSPAKVLGPKKGGLQGGSRDVWQTK